MYCEIRDVCLDNEHSYSLNQIKEELNTIFGARTARRLLLDLIEGIKSQHALYCHPAWLHALHLTRFQMWL